MKYTYTTSTEQWIEFQLFQTKKKFDANTKRIPQLILTVVLNLAFIGNILMNIFFNTMDPFEKIVLTSCVLILYDWHTLPKLFYSARRIRKRCAQLLDENSDIFTEQKTTLEIKENKLYLEDENGTASITPLNLIYKIDESRLSILIYRKNNIAELVPKSIFSTSEEKKQFIHELRSFKTEKSFREIS